MRLSIIFACLMASFAAGDIRPTRNMSIDSSCVLTPGTYLLKSPGTLEPAIRVSGDGAVVDFSGVTLLGCDDPTRPDLFAGLALEVKGNNVTIKGLHARGYKIALRATDCANLKMIDCDFSYNYRPQLKSTPWQEDLEDWMSFHHNESDEWLEHAPAVYLKNCDGFLIQNLTVTNGQSGVLLSGCDNGVMHSSLLSFNSGVGVGLYRSTNNRFSMNRLDFNVRGHSEGIYNRGQDSAAFLVYEQSSNNVFDRNSATHSGDGFFLWAGQSTMDSGKGGCNDNLLIENDFSFAPTNGIELTFSRNTVVRNIIHSCWHGIWGGYSYESLFEGNDFADNVEAINIEHGQDNVIRGNHFQGDRIGIDLYERGTPADWGYGKARDTHSRGYLIQDNHFERMGVGIRVKQTSDLRGSGNKYDSVRVPAQLTNVEMIEPDAGAAAPNPVVSPAAIEGAKLPPPLVEMRRERGSIRVTEWGPHDYRSPLVWPDVVSDPTGKTLLLFDPAGVSGTWSIQTETLRDLPIEQTGLGMKRLVLPATAGKLADVSVTLKWIGDLPTVDRFGQSVPARTPITLSYRRFQAALAWHVELFKWDDDSDPRKNERAFASKPVAKQDRSGLDLRGNGPWLDAAPADHFATRAETSFEAPAGNYLLKVTSDDGVRVFLDGKQVFADWTYHVPKTDEIPLKLDGHHALRIEHFEIDGYAQLRAELEKRD